MIYGLISRLKYAAKLGWLTL